jgi:hypothetical protein
LETPNTLIDFESPEKGLLVPRIDSSVRNAIIPNLNEESLLVYDNDLKQFMFWDGSEWSQIGNKERYVYTQDGNILMGFKAGHLLLPQPTSNEGKFNVILGSNTGAQLVLGASNTFIGNVAGLSMKYGTNNVLIGNNAGTNIDTSSFLTAVGNLAGNNNKGDRNAFYGAFSGRDNTTGHSNTFIGHSAGDDNEIGVSNTFIGNLSGQSNSVGHRNTFVGSSSGYNAKGNFNTLIGVSAGYDFEGGFRNVAIGMDSGRGIKGNSNILIGTAAGFKQDSLYNISNSIFIGNAIGNESPLSHQLLIETNDNDHPLIQGDFLNNTLNLNAIVTIDHLLRLKSTSFLLACAVDNEGMIQYYNHKLRVCTQNSTGPSVVYEWQDLH